MGIGGAISMFGAIVYFGKKSSFNIPVEKYWDTAMKSVGFVWPY